MSGKLRVATMVVFCAVLVPGGSILAATLSGRVYEGSTGDESKPLAGVTVTLYGSNNSGQKGTSITSTTTNSEGWYGLEAEGGFEYYSIVETNPAGYTSAGAATVGGTVMDSDWIQYDIVGLRGTTTGNKFWDKKQEQPPENHAPTAQDDSASTSQDTAVDIYVLANDSDPDSDPLHVNSATDPAHGTTVNHGTHVTYTPDPGFTGTDTFDYTAGDGRGGTDTATVTVTVERGTEPPPGTGTLDGYKRDADTGAGLEKWRIYIDLNANGQWDPGEPNDLTDGNGYYRIDNVEPGMYRVCEQMQAGWEGGEPCVEGIAVLAGVTTTQDFRNRRTQPPGGTGAIRGTKYHDLDGNGQKDPGEPGLSGWEITLADAAGNLLASTTTDAVGNYSFDALAAGDYYVDEVLQPGWQQTAPLANGVPTYWLVAVTAGDSADGIDFGNRREGTPPEGRYDYGDAPLPYPEASHQVGGPYLGPFGDAPDSESAMQRDAQAAGDDKDAKGDDEDGLLSVNLVKTAGAWSSWELKGYFDSASDAKFGLWLDLNGDGDWDDSGELLNSFGFCGFGAGPQSWFHVMGAFPLPANAKAGTTYARLRVYGDCNATVSPSGAGGPGEVEDYLVEIKTDGPGVPPGGIVHGYKWNDINGNGLWDILNPVEPPLAGWTMWLDTNHSGKQDAGDTTAQTDAQGHFRFTGVPAGTYTLGEQLQAGWTQTTPGGAGTYSVTVQPGQGTFPQMFGNRRSGGTTSDGRIRGSKWNDLNGSGTYDAGEPGLAHWKIYLDLTHNGQWDTGEPFQLTDAGGNFEFTKLAPGSYTVAEEIQAGWQQTWPGGAGTHTVSIQPGVQPAPVTFGNTTRSVPPDTLKKFDWGDAPDPTYPTLRTSNGAYHVAVPGFHLGQSIDSEPDGQPAPNALGDDHFGADDEDGVAFLTPILPGGTAGLEIVASAAGFVDAWIDFDGDGTWNSSVERILTAKPVAAGSNTLSVAIPASAPLHLATFARFRLSRTGGLSPDGPGQDGEVEDYHILIGAEGPGVPGAGERLHLKWSQPPLEIDPNVDPNAPQTFCAWLQSSKATVLADGRRVWNMAADDFHGLGPVPVTGLRWWGFYKGWTEPQPPAVQPLRWQVTFWVNRPEPADENPFPEKMVWRLDIPVERVRTEPAGMDGFPHPFSEMCFRYELALEPNEWFRQEQFAAEQDLYWVSVAAVYPEGTPNKNLWGWATRPEVWRNPGQIVVLYGDGPDAQTQLWPGTLLPVTSSDLCGPQRGYDMAFELLTAPPWVKWDQPFDGLRAWPHYEDLESQGILTEQQENIGRLVADDWTSDGNTPVLAIAWWGSYLGYGHEACRCLEPPEPPRPDYFLLTVRTSFGPDREADYARPGEIVWQYRAFDFDEVLVGYDRNPAGEPNEPVYRYSVRLPQENWFRPPNAGSHYWFSVAAVYIDPLPAPIYPWGWTNHPQASGAGAAFIDYRLATPPQWRPLRDPQDRPVDMSFTLFTEPEEFESMMP